MKDRVKEKLKSFFIVTTIFYYLSTHASAAEVNKYYVNQFPILENYGYKVLTTSSLSSNTDSFNTGRYVLICNSDYEHQHGWGCGYNYITSSPSSQKAFDVKRIQSQKLSNRVIEIMSIKGNQESIIVIPEIYTLTPTYRYQLVSYFSTLPKLEKPTYLTNIPEDKKDEVSVIAQTCVLILLAVLATPTNLFSKISLKTIIYIKAVAAILLIALIAFYILLTVPEYPNLFLLISNFYNTAKNYVLNSSFVTVSSLTLGIFSVAAIAYLIKISCNKLIIYVPALQHSILFKLVFLICISFIFFVSASGTLGYFADYISIVFATLVLLHYLINKQKQPQRIYTGKWLIVAGVIISIFTLLGMLAYNRSLLPSYKSQEIYLTDVNIHNKPAAVLPRRVLIKNYNTVADFWISPNLDLFVNNVMVASKSPYNKISNVSIDNLQENVVGTILVLSPDHKTYINNIVSNNIFEHHASTTKPTRFFKTMQNFPQSEDIEIELEFDCSQNPKDSELTIYLYSMYSDNPTIAPEDKMFMFFPGCSSDHIGKFRVPLEVTSDRLRSSVLEVTGDASNHIKNIEIYISGISTQLIFYKDIYKNVFILDGRVSDKTNNKQLTVYTADLQKPVFMDNDLDAINLGGTINQLFYNHDITNNVVIWSPDTSLLVQNEQ